MIIAIATFRCKEDKKQAWLDWLAGDDGLVKTRAYDGCQLIETLSSPETSTVMLYEKWDSVEQHQAYVGWRLANGLGEMLEEMLESQLSYFVLLLQKKNFKIPYNLLEKHIT